MKHRGVCEMKLNAGARNGLSTSEFAGPQRSFPIPDISHGRAALSMAHYASDPAAIKAKVHAKFPSIGAGNSKVRAAVMAKLSGR
jgi:hypothetical protein